MAFATVRGIGGSAAPQSYWRVSEREERKLWKTRMCEKDDVGCAKNSRAASYVRCTSNDDWLQSSSKYPNVGHKSASLRECKALGVRAHRSSSDITGGYPADNWHHRRYTEASGYGASSSSLARASQILQWCREDMNCTSITHTCSLNGLGARSLPRDRYLR